MFLESQIMILELFYNKILNKCILIYTININLYVELLISMFLQITQRPLRLVQWLIYILTLIQLVNSFSSRLVQMSKHASVSHVYQNIWWQKQRPLMLSISLAAVVILVSLTLSFSFSLTEASFNSSLRLPTCWLPFLVVSPVLPLSHCDPRQTSPLLNWFTERGSR